jgi:hypothetical protein
MGILIGTFVSAALSVTFWIICVIFNFNKKRLNFYTQMLLYSLLIAVISFMCIILIKTW